MDRQAYRSPPAAPLLIPLIGLVSLLSFRLKSTNLISENGQFMFAFIQASGRVEISRVVGRCHNRQC